MSSLPAQWETWKFAHAFRSIGSGTTPNTANQGYFGGGTPWLNTGDLTDSIVRNISKTVTDLALAEYSTLRVFAPGSLVIAMYGATIGKLGILESAVCVNQACCVLAEPSALDTKFTFYWLWANRQNIVEMAKGGGQPNISQETIRQLRVAAPPLPAQKVIADYLDKKTAVVDALIEKKRKLLDLLAEERAALINQAVTKGLDSAVPMKDSGVPWIGEVPGHWEVKRLKFASRLETGHTPSRSEPSYWIEDECVIPWVSLNDTKILAASDTISDTFYKISPLGMANSSAHLIPAGAVVFTRDATIGLAALTDRPMAVSQHIIAWVCGPDLLNRFLLHVMAAMGQELDRLTFGATLKTIGMGAVKQIVTPLPPVDEQNKIVKFFAVELRRLDSTGDKITRQLDRLQEYRQSLITAAVTGQLDIEAAA